MDRAAPHVEFSMAVHESISSQKNAKAEDLTVIASVRTRAMIYPYSMQTTRLSGKSGLMPFSPFGTAPNLNKNNF